MNGQQHSTYERVVSGLVKSVGDLERSRGKLEQGTKRLEKDVADLVSGQKEIKRIMYGLFLFIAGVEYAPAMIVRAQEKAVAFMYLLVELWG